MRNIRKPLFKTRRNSEWFELNRIKENTKNEPESNETR
jgi:hypothetical protein